MSIELSQLDALTQKIKDLQKKLDIGSLKNQVIKLEKESTSPDLWQNENNARSVLQKLSQFQQTIEDITSLEKSVSDLQDLLSIQKQTQDTTLSPEIDKMYRQLLSKTEKLELKTYLSGQYDHLGAVLSVHSGQGGTEAMDWASMLLRMYIRYCESQGWKYQLASQSDGEEAGIKSATIIISTPYAYGYLKGESGTHRLVRLSPFNADNLRQTSFAGVEVMPVMDNSINIEIKPEDIQSDFFRSSGPGGQNVNKVNSAVRLKHLPSGVVVECQTQRQQVQNREFAMQMLKAKLWEIEEKKRQEEASKIKGEHHIPGWGHQIRSYILHPYKLVKDVRTQVESSDPDSVLDGGIALFIEAELKQLSANPQSVKLDKD